MSDGKATPPKKTLGFPKQNSPLPRNSSKTIKTPFATLVLQFPDKQLSRPNNKHVFAYSPHRTPLHPIWYSHLYPKRHCRHSPRCSPPRFLPCIHPRPRYRPPVSRWLHSRSLYPPHGYEECPHLSSQTHPSPPGNTHSFCPSPTK